MIARYTIEDDKTHVLVRNNLDVLYVTSSLEDLAQHILRDAGIQAADVQRPLIRLGGGAARERAAARRRHDLIARHGRGNSGRDGVRVGRDVQRRRRHVGVGAVLAVLVAGSACVGLRRGRKLASGNTVVGHGWRNWWW